MWTRNGTERNAAYSCGLTTLDRYGPSQSNHPQATSSAQRRLLFAAPGPLTPPTAKDLADGCPARQTWQVLHAYSLEDALKTAKRSTPDIIVVDLMLPYSHRADGAGGLAPREALGSLAEAVPDAAIVALIPDVPNQLNLARQAFLAGAQDVLTQAESFYSAKLVEAVRTAVERKHTASTAERIKDDYVRLIDNAPVGIFRSTPGGRYLSANRALAELYGFDRPEDLIETLTDIGNQLYVEPNRRADFANLLAFSGRIDGFESQVRRNDGTVIWITESARVVCDDAGTALFYEGFVRDISLRKQAEEKAREVLDNLESTIAGRTRQLRQEITERRYAEESMRQAKEQAEVASQTKARFLANMSHELRTPLNAIIGFTQLMETSVKTPDFIDTMDEYVRHVRTAGEHLLAMVNDLLDMAKIDAGHFELAEEAVNLPALAYDVCTIVQGRAEQNGCSLELDVPSTLPAFKGDSRRMMQVLLNLLSNAVKFTPSGGHVALSLTVNRERGMEIVVADTGIGMAPEDIPRALSEFGQIGNPTVRGREGTGLGLPLARKLTELHGGRIAIQSARGEGTTIRLTFPPERTMETAAA